MGSGSPCAGRRRRLGLSEHGKSQECLWPSEGREPWGAGLAWAPMRLLTEGTRRRRWDQGGALHSQLHELQEDEEDDDIHLNAKHSERTGTRQVPLRWKTRGWQEACLPLTTPDGNSREAQACRDCVQSAQQTHDLGRSRA